VKNWKFYFSSSLNLFLCGLISFGAAFSTYIALSHGKVRSLFSANEFYLLANDSVLFSLNIVLRLLFFTFSTMIFIFSLNDIATFNSSLYQVNKWRSFRSYQLNNESDIYLMLFLTFAAVGIFFYSFFILKYNIFVDVFSGLFR